MITTKRRMTKWNSLPVWLLCTGWLTFGAETPVLPSLTVGRNLQASATITLPEPAAEELEITLTSEDPARLLLAKDMASAGVPSLKLTVRPRMRETPEFWVHALDDNGTVNYTAESKVFNRLNGTVILSPSAVLLMGPLRAPSFRTTRRAGASKLSLYPVRLDSSLRYVEQQAVAGGMRLPLELTSSDEQVGIINPATVAIAGGESIAVTDFEPVGFGKTTLTVTVPPGLTRPAEHFSLNAEVHMPGLAITQDLVIGENLQVGGMVGLGEPAPAGGLVVTLTSDDPKRLLISDSQKKVGSGELKVTIPAGGISAQLFLQALAKSGTVTYRAEAPGYQTRKASVSFSPSGAVLMLKPYGPPDEAELAGHGGSPTTGVFASLSKKEKLPLAVWLCQLDPTTLRGADITVQPLRAGAPLEIALQTSNPAIGHAGPVLRIEPGSERGMTEFVPSALGSTVISIVTPQGFTKPANSTAITATVIQ